MKARADREKGIDWRDVHSQHTLGTHRASWPLQIMNSKHMDPNAELCIFLSPPDCWYQKPKLLCATKENRPHWPSGKLLLNHNFFYGLATVLFVNWRVYSISINELVWTAETFSSILILINVYVNSIMWICVGIRMERNYIIKVKRWTDDIFQMQTQMHSQCSSELPATDYPELIVQRLHNNFTARAERQ